MKAIDRPTLAEILGPGDGPRVYTKRQVMALLSISSVTYHKLIKIRSRQGQPLLRSSRIFPGGPRRHTQKQYDDLMKYLDTEGEVGAVRLKRRRGAPKCADNESDK
jgi:hypothetical protein